MPIHRSTWSRLLTLTWLVAWVLTVPLFHVHVPDAKAGPVSLHSGMPHTVFSADLPGEFSHFSLTRERRSDSLDLSQLNLNYPELGFTILNKSKERKIGQPIDLACSFRHPRTRQIFFTRSGLPNGTGHSVRFARPPSSRAPPFLACT